VTKPPTDLLLAASKIRDMTGPAAPPRINGELVYEAPWQRRAFGIAVATTRHLGLDWDQFRVRLMAAIADEPDRPYYDSWVAALERLVVDRGLVTTQDIDNRVRPAPARGCLPRKPSRR